MEEYKSGSIEIILGCMFSGKTTELITRCKKWSSINKNVLCINYAEDKRYGNDGELYSHSLEKINCLSTIKLSEIPCDIINSSSVILINEGQFFSDLYYYCKYWADTLKKNIIVSGLDGNYQRSKFSELIVDENGNNIQKFGQILDLIPLCDSVTKLTAYCVKCGDRNPPVPAIFTHRISSEKEQKVIGNSSYIALCRYHYLLENRD